MSEDRRWREMQEEIQYGAHDGGAWWNYAMGDYSARPSAEGREEGV